MEAANLGATEGRQEANTRVKSIGLSIQLTFEPEPNKHLDIQHHHHRFSSRLDDFVRLSHAVVVTPGGIGTLLELFFVWQLLQVKHIAPRPLVLVERAFWTPMIAWINDTILARGLISPKDILVPVIVDTPAEAVKVVLESASAFWQAASATCDVDNVAGKK
jgi:predicted Rossmann-fold nucleotide-binding protein